MLLLYSEKSSPRWNYIATTLLQDIAGFQIGFTNDLNKFLTTDCPGLNYSDQRTEREEIFIPSSGFLFESNIRITEISVTQGKEYPFFFPVSGGDFSFDLFAASFYLISRYEEYLPHEKDSYGRYAHMNSLAFRNNFLKLPLVNIWMHSFRKIIRNKFPGLPCSESSFRFLPTYDIDIAYSWLHKGFARTAGGLLKSMVKLEFNSLVNRLKVLAGTRPDPFDVYEWLYALHLKYNLRPHYFFLLAKKVKGYDRNNDPLSTAMWDLISYHGMGYPMGIHPSWQSGDQEELLKEEIRLLSEITGKPVKSSRQHYIRFQLPHTYRRLMDAGIEKEFSMGYGSINGFRASVASPFRWYDLEKETETELMVYPFCFMDANAYYEQKLTPAQAYQEIKLYHDIVKRYGGTLITIWHNSFFGTDPQFAGWKDVYELFLKEVVYWDI